jgi:hypothetical protein
MGFPFLIVRGFWLLNWEALQPSKRTADAKINNIAASPGTERGKFFMI